MRSTGAKREPVDISKRPAFTRIAIKANRIDNKSLRAVLGQFVFEAGQKSFTLAIVQPPRQRDVEAELIEQKGIAPGLEQLSLTWREVRRYAAQSFGGAGRGAKWVQLLDDLGGQCIERG